MVSFLKEQKKLIHDLSARMVMVVHQPLMLYLSTGEDQMLKQK
jgi:hypothetical protein